MRDEDRGNGATSRPGDTPGAHDLLPGRDAPEILVVLRDHHPAGEYHFTPEGLALSIVQRRCRVEIRADGRTVLGTSMPGDIHVMPAGHPHRFRHREGCTFAFIEIRDLAGSAAPELAAVAPQVRLRDAALQHVIAALLTGTRADTSPSLFREAAAAAIVARLRELDGARPAHPRQQLPAVKLRRVIEYLEARLADDVTVAELARIADLSPAHFSTLFRNATGEPPHRYHTRLRVERARRLLEAGATATDAALAVGFCDQSHLSRQMRRILGVTPGRLQLRR